METGISRMGHLASDTLYLLEVWYEASILSIASSPTAPSFTLWNNLFIDVHKITSFSESWIMNFCMKFNTFSHWSIMLQVHKTDALFNKWFDSNLLDYFILYFDSQFPFLGLNNFAEAVLTLASSHRNGKFLTTLGYKDS